MKSVFSHSFIFKISTAFVAVALVLATLPVRPVYAATLTVTSSADTIAVDAVCTLREAIANANSDALTNADCVAGTGNDTIVFNIPLASPTIALTSSLPTITDVDGLIIDGTNLNALGGTVTISGGSAVRIVSVTAGTNGATFQDLVLANGAVNGNGGAINNTGNLTVNNVTFTSNSTITTATNNGGAIYHNTGTLNINNSTFSSNSTQNSGGAVYIAGGSGTLQINGSAFSSNSAINGSGGAVFQVVGTTLSIGNVSGNTFTTNSALVDGGAIRQGGTLTIGTAVNTFTGNTAGGNGGAINVQAGALTVLNGVFTNTSGSNTGTNGGAIYHNSATLLTVTNSTFTGNRSLNDGGAIILNNSASSATISGSTFASNEAGDDAAAIYNNGGPFVVTTSTFQSNSAGSAAPDSTIGGAIRNTVNSVNANSAITLSSFIGNSVTMNANLIVEGGAIANEGTLSIANVTFSGNSLTKTTTGAGSALGGAVYANNTTTIHNSTFSGNSVSENGTGVGSGGSIYSLGGAMTIANSIVSGGTENGVAGNCGGTITNGGNNIDFNGGDCVFAITINPQLGGLTGSPAYFPLTSGSSALDTGSNAICATATTTNNQSQNGVARPQDGDNSGVATCDIGSYEMPDPAPIVVSIVRVNPDPTNLASVQFTVTFNESVTGGSNSNFSVTTTGGVSGASVTTVTGSGTTRTVTVNTGSGDGTIRLDMVNSTGVTDGGGNAVSNVPFTTGEVYTVDKSAPTVVISSAASNPTSTSPIPVTITFSEAVSGFVVSDITVGNGTAGNFNTADNITFTADITPTVNGLVTVDVGAGVAQDAVGNGNIAATQFSITYDNNIPTVTITSTATSPTNVSPIPVTITFSEAVSGFVVGDITVGNGTAGNFNTADNITFTADITPTATGLVTVDVGAGVAQDGAGNNNTAATQFSITYDNAAPTVTITSTATSPTNISPIPVTITFSEAVSGFVVGDITVGNGTAGNFNTADNITFTADITPTANGLVTVDVGANVAQDGAGNNNTAATQFSITYDDTIPSVTVNQAAGQADPTNASPINFTAVFSKPINTATFIATDVTLGGTAPGTLAAVITEIAPNDGTTFNIAVSGMTDNGTVTASIAAGMVQDPVGNINTASTSTDNLVTYDSGNPSVISTNLTASYTGTGPGSFVVTFSEAVDDPAGNTGTDDVTNIANYLLVNKGTNGIANTVSCAGGVAADDTNVTVTSVVYNNATFQSTVTLASPLPVGSYRLFICGTTSIVDLSGNPLNGGTDYTFDFVVQAAATQSVSGSLPATGFPMNEVTSLPFQSANLAYASYSDLWLEIPSLGVKMSIVGVPSTKGGWNVTWLNKDAGWLNGSAYPTWNGNSVLTGHVWDALNLPGPFANLKNLKYGDQIKIHAFGQVYIYEVRESRTVLPTSISAVFKHEEKSWITLLTCEDYKETSKSYSYRRMIRAVLISVISE